MTPTSTAPSPTPQDNDGFHSLSGLVERTKAPASISTTSENGTTGSLRHQTLAGQRSLHLSGSPSSPLSSREASPARPQQRNAPPANHTRPGFRSRKSSADVSPSRTSSLANSSTTSTTATVPRALSSTSIPELTPTSSTDTVRASRPANPKQPGDAGPHHWPISPRLRSPPPGDDGRPRSRTNSLRSQIRKPEAQSTPAIIVQSSSPASLSGFPRNDGPASDPEEPQQQSMKVPLRGSSGVAPKLETVQESSSPATPGFGGLEPQSLVSSATVQKSDTERNDVNSSKVTEDLSNSKHDNSNNSSSRNTGSGSDSATRSARKGKMQEQRASYTHRPHTVSAKPSLSSMSNRSRDPPLRNMTVETETVPSVAQASIVNQDRSASGRVDGGVRLKPSNETIRPKNNRKPAKRKAASINAGTASSKADVFEQKVASAVDEADSSDSDATFIYESNPPEQPHRSRQPGHHSRTPSMTSLASLTDPRLQIRDTQKHPSKKSSIKFTNPYNNASIDGDDRGEGTVRIGSGRAGGGSHHHHIGRHGQGRGALNHLVMDSDSSMPQSSRVRGPSSRHTSQPNSPRIHQFSLGNGHSNGIKKNGEYSAAYDLDAENIADDERTPLITPGRSPRARTTRQRNGTSIRQLERRHHRDGGWCRRFAGCLVLSILLLVVVFCAVGLVFATTKPLTSLMVREIQNVVASQEEVMLDLIVDAVNPNIIGVTVSDMDVSLFAKSKHVGSDAWWREHGNGPHGPHDNVEHWKPIDTAGVDEGTDPVEGEPRTMLLGRIYRFDSPLNFEGSFFQRHRAESIGELRLSHPGNKTEAGGSERWEEVLQYPFELIVRGNFKYTLPLSTQEFKVPVTASHYYDPDIERRKRPVAPEGLEKRRDSPPVPTKPLGRYDRRALPSWNLQ
ncbi:Vac7 multi-domain protein [Pyrenophora tritici-repentis]|nr:Vac7 multi-domain protein [Pyrenophora tritici-repentis]KAI0583169.1 Vac7 multi-domain protein [Pyrenophora tritici-repentis]KAI0610086.1 Vac7 multi-domain protein [Pyrenophora tritici-repentis]KAI0622009.1 Vac7 multi-domain protein [Pyrenophora tritici-repentis]